MLQRPVDTVMRPVYVLKPWVVERGSDGRQELDDLQCIGNMSDPGRRTLPDPTVVVRYHENRGLLETEAFRLQANQRQRIRRRDRRDADFLLERPFRDQQPVVSYLEHSSLGSGRPGHGRVPKRPAGEERVASLVGGVLLLGVVAVVAVGSRGCQQTGRAGVNGKRRRVATMRGDPGRAEQQAEREHETA